MPHTNTTTHQAGLPFRPLAAPAAADVRSNEHVEACREQQEELAMDDALAASFPASDPPAWNPGVARPIPAGASDEASQGP
jgi:hypothetical protein